jgi:hypothetical protein
VTPDSNSQYADGQGPADYLAIFAFCRVETVRPGRLVTGRLRPGLTPESAEVQEALADWPGSVGVREEPLGWELFLFEPVARRERWWLHALLFGATLFSTVVAGSLLKGHWPIGFELVRALWFRGSLSDWPWLGSWRCTKPATTSRRGTIGLA